MYEGERERERARERERKGVIRVSRKVYIISYLLLMLFFFL